LLDISISILFILSGFVFIASKKNHLEIADVRNLKKLWVFHLLFSFVFYLYTRTNSADTNGYWRIAKESSWEDILFFMTRGMGTPMMYIVNYFPSKVLDLSIFTGTMIYAFLGFLGIYFFYRIVIDLIPYNSRFFGFLIFPLLFFLPSLHFWGSGTGKDTLLFLSIGMFAFSLMKMKRRILLLLAGGIIALLIRPHVFIILLASAGCAFLTTTRIKGYKRVFSFMILSTMIILILPKVLEYVNLEGNSLEEAFNRLDEQASNLSGDEVGSSIDIQSYPFYLKVLTFLYRPLFFDYNGLFSLVTSFENLLLLLLTIKVLLNKPVQAFKQAPLVIKMLLLFLIFGTLIFAFSLSNLGIILRMKNMFVPGLLIYFIWSLSYSHSVENATEIILKKENN
jgi:hypothetical protein